MDLPFLEPLALPKNFSTLFSVRNHLFSLFKKRVLSFLLSLINVYFVIIKYIYKFIIPKLKSRNIQIGRKATIPIVANIQMYFLLIYFIIHSLVILDLFCLLQLRPYCIKIIFYQVSDVARTLNLKEAWLLVVLLFFLLSLLLFLLMLLLLSKCGNLPYIYKMLSLV